MLERASAHIQRLIAGRTADTIPAQEIIASMPWQQQTIDKMTHIFRESMADTLLMVIGIVERRQARQARKGDAESISNEALETFLMSEQFPPRPTK